MGPELETIAISAGVTAAVAALGSAGVMALSRRSVAAAAATAPLVVVASLAAGIASSARQMIISERDSTTVLLIVAAAAPVAILVGILIARRIRRLDVQAAQHAAAAARDREVEASRRELIAWLSHDLKTPLAGIRAISEAVTSGAAPDPSAYLQRLQGQVDRMSSLVDDVLELSRAQSGATTAARQEVGLADLVSDAVSDALPVADARGVAVIAAELQDVAIYGDPGALARTVANLVENAVDHSGRGSTVAVSTSRDGGWAVLSVTDACGGIAGADLPRVFEPGWRGTEARTPDDRGAGLGLAIVRSVVERHGGEVGVVNVDGGCRFTVRLPVVPDA